MVDTSSALSCASFCPFFTKSAGEPGLDKHYHRSTGLRGADQCQGSELSKKADVVMMFSASEYRKSLADYRAKWCAIDETLYDLCRRYPDHSDLRGINAKLWIIGRTYATGIERKIFTQGSQGSS